MKLLACFFLFALLFLSKVALAPGFKGRMLEFQKFKEVKNSRQNHLKTTSLSLVMKIMLRLIENHLKLLIKK